MTETREHELQLCPGIVHNGVHFTCGRIVLERDPTDPLEACPHGLTLCKDCTGVFGDFMRRAYDARARRKEHKVDQP